MLTSVEDSTPGRQGTKSRDRYGHKSRRGDLYGPSEAKGDAGADLLAAAPPDGVMAAAASTTNGKEPFGFNLVIVGVPAFTDTAATEHEVSVRHDVVAP
ncbi:hypothetical protein [Micromonospora orduensis]|uniref:hypothetical protein n=1 Tax=Micromonospora orduensis TaxID=1420891 RepID=UPI00142EA5AA|nr:hypothetical protein [Micromonospora orduensis]